MNNNNSSRLVLTEKAIIQINSLHNETFTRTMPKLQKKNPVSIKSLDNTNTKEPKQPESPRPNLKSDTNNVDDTSDPDAQILQLTKAKAIQDKGQSRDQGPSTSHLMDTSQDSKFSYKQNNSRIKNVMENTKKNIKGDYYSKITKHMQKLYKISKSVNKIDYKPKDKLENQSGEYKLFDNTHLNKTARTKSELPNRPILSFSDNVRSLGYLRDHEKNDPFKELEEKLDGIDIVKDAMTQKSLRCKNKMTVKHKENIRYINSIHDNIKKSIERKKNLNKKYFKYERSCIMNTSREINQSEKSKDDEEVASTLTKPIKGIRIKAEGFYKKKYFAWHKKENKKIQYVNNQCSKFESLHEVRKENTLKGSMNITVFNNKAFKTLREKTDQNDTIFSKHVVAKTERSFSHNRTQRNRYDDNFLFWNEQDDADKKDFISKINNNTAFLIGKAGKMQDTTKAAEQKSPLKRTISFFPKLNIEEQQCHEMNPELNKQKKTTASQNNE